MFYTQNHQVAALSSFGSRGQGGKRENVSESEHRRATRESTFLHAALRVDGEKGEHRIKIRNLSPTGLMAEYEGPVRVGIYVEIKIRNIGWVHGSVAWVEGNRFGVLLAQDMDPREAQFLR